MYIIMLPPISLVKNGCRFSGLMSGRPVKGDSQNQECGDNRDVGTECRPGKDRHFHHRHTGARIRNYGWRKFTPSAMYRYRISGDSTASNRPRHRGVIFQSDSGGWASQPVCANSPIPRDIHQHHADHEEPEAQGVQEQGGRQRHGRRSVTVQPGFIRPTTNGVATKIIITPWAVKIWS